MSSHTIDTSTGLYIWEGYTRKGKNHTNLVFQKTPQLGCGKTKGMAWKPKRSRPTPWDATRADPRFENRTPDISLEDSRPASNTRLFKYTNILETDSYLQELFTLKTWHCYHSKTLLSNFWPLSYYMVLCPCCSMVNQTRPDPTSFYSIWLDSTLFDSTRLQLGSVPLGSTRAVQYLKPQLLSACNVACHLSTMCITRNRKVMSRARSEPVTVRCSNEALLKLRVKVLNFNG